VQYMQRAKKFDPKPDVAHGQAILWRKGEGSVQGITELTDCVRAEDPWLLEVQNQMRAGELSEDNWNFSRGRETTVPGSWIGGACGCGSDAGRASWLATRKDCDRCQRDRKSRHRVMNSPEDARHLDEHFLTAPAIFPNNDIKYEVNKTKAQISAIQTEQAITWSVAKDVPANKVLVEKQDVAAEKAVWLTRRDRDCGDLYGMLPLVKGLPVSLTVHRLEP
jgi:hypothetical protein